MEQRSLRLGDIVDDYCPRERRVTNHAIVAIVENTIRQTRCSTCDAEHEYKEAKVPKKRPKTGADGSDLAGGVLVVPKVPTNGASPEAGQPSEVPDAAAPAAVAASNGSDADSAAAPSEVESENGANHPQEQPEERQQEGWFTHRRLIRATLPRTDGEPPPQRTIPEFTMHQRQGRGFGGGRGGFRHGFHGHSNQPFRGGNGNGHPNGNSGDQDPDGNRAQQPQRPGGGGGRRRRRRRR